MSLKDFSEYIFEAGNEKIFIFHPEKLIQNDDSSYQFPSDSKVINFSVLLKALEIEFPTQEVCEEIKESLFKMKEIGKFEGFL